MSNFYTDYDIHFDARFHSSTCSSCSNNEAFVRVVNRKSHEEKIYCSNCYKIWKYGIEEVFELQQKRVERITYNIKVFMPLLCIISAIIFIPSCCILLMEYDIRYQKRRYEIMQDTFGKEELAEIAKINKWDGKLPKYNGISNALVTLK